MEKTRVRLTSAQKATTDLCPLRIAEVWVFGSFLRLKEEPGDVDLVVLYREDKEFDAKESPRSIWKASKSRGP